jgi:quercetin dioxygenase-like cupin family protein
MRITSLTLGIAAALLAIAPIALQETPVPVSQEPHHHLKIETADARAYYVEVAPHTATLVHTHDLDYFYVTLSNSPDLTNRVVGKPEQHLSQSNGDMHFTRGGFAHGLSNNGDTPFLNITVVLLKPQGEARNLCAKILADKPLNCDAAAAHAGGDASSVPEFATDQLVVSLDQIGAGQSLDLPTESFRRIVIPLEGSNLILRTPTYKSMPIDGGHVVEVPPGSGADVKNVGTDPARVYVAAFHSTANAK